MIRAASAAAGLVSLVLLSPGCIFSPQDSSGGPGPGPTVPLRNSVQGAIDLYAYVWTSKDYDRYQQLLHNDFEYFPQTVDLQDLHWLTGDSWGRTEELQMAHNMFNPDFQPADPHAGSIDSIKMQLQVLSQENDPQRGGVVVTTHATAQVLYDASNGASSDVRFEFLVVPDPAGGGLYQIKQQKELALH
jgi:hypothetical protein